MKKTLFHYLFAILSVVLFATSCSDDEPSLPIDKEIAGTYKGALKVSVAGTVIATDLPKNITISKASDVAVNMELKDFSFLGIDLGTIALKNCALSQNGTSYSFTSEQTLELDAVGPCPTKVSGTINGAQIVVNLDITVTNQNNLKVAVVYTGSRLAGGEKSEAAITSFTFDNTVAANSVVLSVPVIDEAKKTITFMVAETASTEDLRKIIPTIVVSDKAKITPGSDIAQNFNAPVVYTVIAENGKETKYTASISNTIAFYDFEQWTNEGASYGDVFNPAGWATCNDAVGLIKNMGYMGGITYEGEYPVRETTDYVTGEKALLIESVFTKGGVLFNQKVPKVTSGTAFLGTFDAFKAMVDPMATTAFGIMYDKKPIKVTGFFKYTAGTEYYDVDDLVPNIKDECAISVVLYEVSIADEDVAEGEAKETLDGSTIYDSEKIVASAKMTNRGTADYDDFALDLVYHRAYDPTKLYKFSIIFASSKEGADYKGAVGSKLYIDNVTIINE